VDGSDIADRDRRTTAIFDHDASDIVRCLRHPAHEHDLALFVGVEVADG